MNVGGNVKYEINRISAQSLKPFALKEINIGPVDEGNTTTLLNTFNEYRDCFIQSLEELGTEKNDAVFNTGYEDTLFTYRLYRMAITEGETMREMKMKLFASHLWVIYLLFYWPERKMENKGYA